MTKICYVLLTTIKIIYSFIGHVIQMARFEAYCTQKLKCLNAKNNNTPFFIATI